MTLRELFSNAASGLLELLFGLLEFLGDVLRVMLFDINWLDAVWSMLYGRSSFMCL